MKLRASRRRFVLRKLRLQPHVGIGTDRVVLVELRFHTGALLSAEKGRRQLLQSTEHVVRVLHAGDMRDVSVLAPDRLEQHEVRLGASVVCVQDLHQDVCGTIGAVDLHVNLPAFNEGQSSETRVNLVHYSIKSMFLQ